MNCILAVKTKRRHGAADTVLTRGLAQFVPTIRTRSDTRMSGLCAIGCATATDNCATAALHSDEHGVVVAMSGSLDNRGELKRLLGRQNNDLSSDPTLIALAYRKWGAECAKRFVGDFGILISDPERDELLAVRDQVGVKRLYWTEAEDYVVVGSHLSCVACTTSRRLSEEYIAEFLVGGIQVTATTTPYRDIHKLAPGNLLEVKGQARPIESSYFAFGETQGNTSANPSTDWDQQFTDLFNAAVDTRLPAGATALAELSGGLDSSAIVGIADHLLHARTDGAAMSLVTMSFPSAVHSDEVVWARAVAEKVDRPWRRVDGDAHHPLKDLVAAAEWWNEPSAQIVLRDSTRVRP